MVKVDFDQPGWIITQNSSRQFKLKQMLNARATSSKTIAENYFSHSEKNQGDFSIFLQEELCTEKQ